MVCGLALLFLVSCEKEEEKTISLLTQGTAELYSVTNQTTEIRFRSEEAWKANCSANWLTFSPKSGKAGENVITIATTSTNRTQKPRTAVMTIEAGSERKTINIKQRDEYAYFEKEELNLGCQKTTVGVNFYTNLEQDQLLLYSTADIDSWITLGDEVRTRTDYQGRLYPLQISSNDSQNPREGAFFLVMKDDKNNVLGLDTLYIHQEGSDNGYRSNDYSQDGKVEQLNKATVGKGIPIVLMGDGFQDRHIADSTYSRVMNQAMENLFSEEPFKSLKEYFDIYAVTAVSKHNNFGEGYETALSTVPDQQTMGIKMDTKRVMDYVKKVESIDSLNTLAVVILNTNIRRGVTYMFYDKDKNPPINYAIALCSVIDSLKSEMFRSVLVHEAVGHGFAKLADEYVRSTEGSATETEIKWLKEYHEEDRLLNVDSESDPSKTLWSRFVSDPEYANEELGAYEGGWTYYTGVYRPSKESMMRSNDAPFNAPSRRAIYNRVMLLAKREKPSYEDFVAFDREHKPTVWSYESRTRQSEGERWHPAPPRIIWRTW